MDPRKHDRLLEALEELSASLRVAPQLPQPLRARGIGRLIVADTDVLDGLQLAKVADKDHGDVAEVVFLRIETPLGKERPLGLLQPAVHAVEEGSSNEGDLVDDQEDDVFPLLLEGTALLAFSILSGKWRSGKCGRQTMRF